MKKILYRSDTRGFTNHGWLKTYHLFSFANFYDESRMGFGNLRVFNEDFVEPGGKFGPHSHDNIEIITIPLEGSIVHKNNFGGEQVSEKGDIQIISAGKGLTHTEYNPSESKTLRFLQLWIYPDQRNGEPSYKHKHFNFKKDHLNTLIRPHDDGESLTILQDVFIYYGWFSRDQKINLRLSNRGKGMFIYMIAGKINLYMEDLHVGDAITIEEEQEIDLKILEDAEFIAVDVPMIKSLE